ncbi:MAG: DUF2937 family protein [Pseudomonadota bacterium]
MFRFIAMVMGIIGALGGSQAPGFTLQYMQNLTGRIDELRPIVEQFDANVASAGYNRTTALAECDRASTSPSLLSALCESYVSTVRRFQLLYEHLSALNATDELRRPLLLAQTFERDIAESVASVFEPAVPATSAGALYAGGGFALLWGGFSFVFGILGALFGGGRREYA